MKPKARRKNPWARAAAKARWERMGKGSIERTEATQAARDARALARQNAPGAAGSTIEEQDERH